MRAARGASRIRVWQRALKPGGLVYDIKHMVDDALQPVRL